MSNQQRPYWQQGTGQPSTTPSSTVQGASPRGSQQQPPALIAGLFHAKRTAINLAVLAGLCTLITFAVVVVVDQALGGFADVTPQSMTETVTTALIAGVGGVAAGLLYIPVVGTGNEDLFGTAIIALAVAAIAVWVIFGGLLDGDWSTLTVLATIICIAGTAYAAPARIDAARVR